MIRRLKVYQVRNLQQIDLSLGQVNVFVGGNGSGKTSLLEAVYVLSRGKSFRHFEPKRYISHGKDACTVWADLGNETLAISKQKDATTHLRHNQNNTSQAAISKRLPTLVIDPSGMGILEEGTTNRRQLLDFLCFHADNHFYGVWLEYQRALKQRNRLLKNAQQRPNHSTIQQIHAWDKGLSEHAFVLSSLRQSVFDNWRTSFDTLCHSLLPQYQNTLNLSFVAGYDTQIPLKDILAQRLEADIEAGYTRIGAHRADLSITTTTQTDGKPHKEHAVNVLSRGQKKLLITALKLSGLPLLCQNGQTPIVLIDDLDSELDNTASFCLMQTLLALPCQIFVSSLDDSISALLPTDHSTAFFDIADGTITPQTVKPSSPILSKP